MARQVTGEDKLEDAEDLDKVAIEEREGFSIMDVKADDDDNDNDDNEDEEDTEEGFAIVVVKVDKRAGVAAQAHVK